MTASQTPKHGTKGDIKSRESSFGVIDEIAKVSYPGRSPEAADSAILAVVDRVWIVTTPIGIEISEGQVHGGLHSTPSKSHVEQRIRSPSRRGDIPLGIPLVLTNFG